MNRTLLRIGMHAGFGLTLAMAAVLLAGDANSALATAMATFLPVGVILAWAAAFLGERQSASELAGVRAQFDSEMRQLGEETQALFRDLRQDFSTQFEVARHEVDQVQKLLSDAVGRLIHSFGEMDRGIAEQMDVAVQVVEGHKNASADGDDSGVPSIARFIRDTGETLTLFVDSTVDTSKHSLRMRPRCSWVRWACCRRPR